MSGKGAVVVAVLSRRDFGDTSDAIVEVVVFRAILAELGFIFERTGRKGCALRYEGKIGSGLRV